MSRKRAVIREAVTDYVYELAAAAGFCRALTLILRSGAAMEGRNLAAAIWVADAAESHARTAREEFRSTARETIAAAGLNDE